MFLKFHFKYEPQALIYVFVFNLLNDTPTIAHATETKLISTQKLLRRFTVQNEVVINYEEKLTAEFQTAEQFFSKFLFCDSTYLIALDILWL